MADRIEDIAASRDAPSSHHAELRRALKRAVEENEAANDALCDYLSRHRDATRGTADRLLAGEHPWEALLHVDAAGRREAYLDVWRRFEDSRQEMRRLTILWAKRVFGISYRSMGAYLGISEQLAIKLGGQAARAHPDESR